MIIERHPLSKDQMKTLAQYVDIIDNTFYNIPSPEQLKKLENKRNLSDFMLKFALMKYLVGLYIGSKEAYIATPYIRLQLLVDSNQELLNNYTKTSIDSNYYKMLDNWQLIKGKNPEIDEAIDEYILLQ